VGELLRADRELLPERSNPVVNENGSIVRANGFHHQKSAAVRPQVVARVRDIRQVIGCREHRATLTWETMDAIKNKQMMQPGEAA